LNNVPVSLARVTVPPYTYVAGYYVLSQSSAISVMFSRLKRWHFGIFR
jgi:hypothetical protein